VIHDEARADGTPGPVERLLPLVDAFIAASIASAGSWR
jgi:hypothetical protein